MSLNKLQLSSEDIAGKLEFERSADPRDLLKWLIESEPPREEGKHRFLGGTCVDCGHPLDGICTANLQLQRGVN